MRIGTYSLQDYSLFTGNNNNNNNKAQQNANRNLFSTGLQLTACSPGIIIIIITKPNRMRIATYSLQDYSLFTGNNNNNNKSAWVKLQYPSELLRSSETLTMLGIYR